MIEKLEVIFFSKNHKNVQNQSVLINFQKLKFYRPVIKFVFFLNEKKIIFFSRCKVIFILKISFFIITESILFHYISGNEFVIQDLNFDTEYEVRVSAQNAIGFSNFTEPLVQRTKGLVAETVVDGSSILSSTFNHSSRSYSFFQNSDLLLVIYILFATNEIFQTLRVLVS